MYVKLFNQILDSSIADNRKLRHFFTDLLLCSDPDGNVLMTNSSISNRTRASLEEVEWGLAELQRPDKGSNHAEYEGRRIIPLEGHGYGWKIINYEHYRDLKSERQKREETKERVRQFRLRKAKKAEARELRELKKLGLDNTPPSGAWLSREQAEVKKYENGEPSECDI